MAEQSVEHLSGWQGDTPQYHQALAQLEGPALHQIGGFAAGVEEGVLGLLDGLVKQFDGAKVPVDQIVPTEPWLLSMTPPL